MELVSWWFDWLPPPVSGRWCHVTLLGGGVHGAYRFIVHRVEGWILVPAEGSNRKLDFGSKVFDGCQRLTRLNTNHLCVFSLLSAEGGVATEWYQALSCRMLITYVKHMYGIPWWYCLCCHGNNIIRNDYYGCQYTSVVYSARQL